MNYEIHITLEVPDIEIFKEDCKEIGIKPILIETQNYNKEQGVQIMTSSQHKGNNYTNTLNFLCNGLFKYKILRKKVEIQPLAKKNKDHLYYESHLRLVLPKNYDLNIVQKLCKDNDFHCSKNLFKTDNDNIYQMITYRGYNIKLQIFQKKIWKIISELQNLKINFDKVEIEECIYDTNIGIDNSWLNKK